MSRIPYHVIESFIYGWLIPSTREVLPVYDHLTIPPAASTHHLLMRIQWLSSQWTIAGARYQVNARIHFVAQEQERSDLDERVYHAIGAAFDADLPEMAGLLQVHPKLHEPGDQFHAHGFFNYNFFMDLKVLAQPREVEFA